MRNTFLSRRQILFGLLAILLFTIRYYLALPPLQVEADALVGTQTEFQGIVVDEPDRRDDFTRYTVKSEERFGQYKILITGNRFPEYQYGDLVEVKGKITFPKNFENDLGNEFDYTNYLAKDGIRYVSFLPQMTLLEHDKGLKFFSALYSVKNKFVANVETALTEPHSSLANGITLGLKQSLGKELLATFRTAGIIHIVVLSGYNMTIILSGLMFTLGKIKKIPRGISLLLGVILMLGFAALVGFSATVLRALIMASLAVLARFLGRPVLAMRTLFIALTAMLLWNPLVLFYDPSFQLSFLATFGLIAVSPIVENRLNRHFSFFAKISNSSPKWKQILKEIFVATIATQIFVLPALIYMTGEFSLISLPVNLLVLPFVSWAMAFTGLVGVFGFLPAVVGRIIAMPAYLILEFIIKVSEFSANIPLSSITLSSVPLFIVFAVYAFFLYLIWRANKTLIW